MENMQNAGQQNHHGSRPCLTRQQAAELRQLVNLRRSLSNKRLAARFGVSEATITKYAGLYGLDPRGRVKPREGRDEHQPTERLAV